MSHVLESKWNFRRWKFLISASDTLSTDSHAGSDRYEKISAFWKHFERDFSRGSVTSWMWKAAGPNVDIGRFLNYEETEKNYTICGWAESGDK